MSERFIVDKDFKEYSKLVDTETDCFYHFEDSLRNVEVFCERLNILVDENDELRQDRNNLAEECSALFKQNGRLKKENEQLREELRFSAKSSQNPYKGGLVEDENCHKCENFTNVPTSPYCFLYACRIDCRTALTTKQLQRGECEYERR